MAKSTATSELNGRFTSGGLQENAKFVSGGLQEGGKFTSAGLHDMSGQITSPKWEDPKDTKLTSVRSEHLWQPDYLLQKRFNVQKQ